MEYIEDLKTYYETGYGNELNKKVGCMPAKDMIEKFTRMIEHPGKTFFLILSSKFVI